MSYSISRTTAQVACRAIINDPYGYDDETILAVYGFACKSGVDSFYTDKLADIIDFYAGATESLPWTGR